MKRIGTSRAFCVITISSMLGGLGCRHGLLDNPTDTTTPLRVRGGAMGFRSDKAWVKNSDGSYCSAIPAITSIDLDNVDPQPSSTITLTFPITLAARKSDGTPDANSGISMNYGTSSNCASGGIQLTTISPTPVPATDSGAGGPIYGFYSPAAGIDTEHEESSSHPNNRIRYKNNTPTCFADSAHPYYDEDACEQMSIITVNGTGYKCINGECELKLHP